MLWEGRPLRDIRDADIRRLIESGLAEHLQLEYKSALYEDNDRGRREFLLDICMFANSSGGILLVGIPERRDEQGQPTGVPDPAEMLSTPHPSGFVSERSNEGNSARRGEPRGAWERTSVKKAIKLISDAALSVTHS